MERLLSLLLLLLGTALQVSCSLVSIQPQAPEIFESQSLTLSCNTSLTSPLTFSWLRDGTLLPGETSFTLSVPSVALEWDDSVLTCVVEDAGNSSTRLSVFSREPVFTEHPSSVTVDQGNVFNLSCSVRGLPQPTVQWYKDGSVFLVISPQGNSLVFPPATDEHEGVYQCRALDSSTQPVFSDTATVTVRFPPEFNIQPESLSVLNNTAASLNCSAKGNPPPTISWFHNGDLVTPGDRLVVLGNGSLIIEAVSMTDSGVYRCHANNALGSIESDDALLMVDLFPLFRRTPQDTTARVGESATLNCSVLAIPSADYAWRHDGVTLTLEDDMRQTTENGSLVFTELYRNHSGSYECTASNLYGEITSDPALLTVLGPPLPPMVTLREIGASWLFLTWDPPTHSHPPVGSYILLYKLAIHTSFSERNTQQQFLNLTGLYPSAHYLIKVRAESPLGLSDSSPLVPNTHTLTGLPSGEGVKDGPDELLVEHTSPHHITVHWIVPQELLNTSYEAALVTLLTSDGANVVDTQSVQSPVSLTDLSPATDYSLEIAFLFTGGHTGPRTRRQVTTHDGIPSQPEGLNATLLSPTALLLHWEPPSQPNGTITAYTVTVGTMQTVVGGNTTELLLGNLMAYTDYILRVSANTSAGQGEESTINITTHQDVPPPPTGLSVEPINATMLLLSWQRPSPLPGVLLHYTIMYNNERINITTLTRTSLVLTGLSPYTLYRVSVAATTGAGIGNFSSTQVTRTLTAAPTAMTIVTALVQSCPYGITVSWMTSDPSAINGPPSDTSLVISVLGTQYNRTITIDYQETGNWTIENVTSFTIYTVAMAITNVNGSGPINNSLTIVSCDTIVGPPDDVAVDTITSTSLRVTWQPVVVSRGTLVGYIVTYSDGSEQTVSTNSTSITLTQLSPYTAYGVGVSTVTGGGPGHSSSFLTVTTLSGAPTTGVVLVSAMADCPSDLLLTWMTSDLSGVNSPPNMTMLTVSLEWDTFSQELSFPYTPSGAGEIRVMNLLLSTNYTLRVALTSDYGSGPQSTPITLSTLSQGISTPPQALTTQPATPTSILVSWQPPVNPNGDPNYIVTYRRANSASDEEYKSISTRGRSTNITDLMVFTRYDIQVSANTSCGLSESVGTSGVTGQTPPTDPNDLRVVAVLPTALVVGWTPPTHSNGAPLIYMVSCGGAAAVSVTMLSYECSGLESNTGYIVTVTASNSAGQGSPVSIATTTSCQDPVPMVTAEDGSLSVYLPMSPDNDCNVTRADYVLVVVQELTSDLRSSRPLSSYTLVELVEATQRYMNTRPRRQMDPNPELYISANISESQLQGDTRFTVGDGLDYGGYINYPLKPGVFYNVGLRGVVSGATTPIFADSSVSPPITALPPETTPPPPEFPVLIVAVAVGAAALILFAILLVACIICACSYCNKRANQYIVANGGGGERITRSSSFRLSAKKKAGDPVDEFRANHRTEALEDHPAVPVVGFIQRLFVMRTNDNQLFLEEFGSINMIPQHSTEVADSNANKRRNRYNNILPYDNNRVKLKSHGCDYINASYCSGYMKNKIYIATQGPIAETVGDFWRLVWEENVRVIIMLTNTSEKGKVKCETYWPRDLGCSAIHGHIEVIMDQATTLADFTIRTFSLQKGSKESRQVKQFHFTSWPDHGVPQHATAMLSMLRRVRSYHSKVAGGPMLVHCSAGVGRTGTFIVIDSMLQRLKNSDTLLDIYGHVTLLRAQRPYMVQTEDQYFFIHEALAEALLCGNTEVNLTTLGGYVTELSTVVPGDQHDTTHIEVQFKRLATDRIDPYRYVTANKDSNKHKNRLVNILPYETNRVVLEYLHGVDGSDYINASHIDSYHNRRAFIATQGPLQSTVGDFWRMVWQYNSPVVVMLTETMEKGMERCAQYWPAEVLQSAVYDRFTVELAVERRSQHYTFRDINITDNQTGAKRCVSHFQFHGWPEVGIPATPSLLLDFIREVQKMYSSLHTNAPITVHCSSGVGRSGVFITLHITLERMKTEGLVDVFQTVKTLRIQRPAMVQTLQQYHFCYESALHFLEGSDLLLTQQRSAQPSAEVSRKRSFRHTPPSSQPSPSRSTAHTTPSRKESFKGSTRTFEAVAQGAHIYGVSEATSTFGSHQASSGSQIALYGSGTLGQQTLSGSQLSMNQRSRSPRLGGSQSALNTPHPPVHVRTASMSGALVPHQLAESQRYSTSSITGWTQ